MPITSRPHDTDGHSIQQRRSFRPMPDFKRAKSNGNGQGNGHYVRNGNGSPNQNNARTAPPEATHAENFYYLKQMSSRTPMVVVLTDGEEIHGCIEWYDKTCLKINREGAPNLLIQKHCIKYLYKKDELD